MLQYPTVAFVCLKSSKTNVWPEILLSFYTHEVGLFETLKDQRSYNPKCWSIIPIPVLQFIVAPLTDDSLDSVRYILAYSVY